MSNLQQPFNCVSDFMERYYRAPEDTGPRKSEEYRGDLRNQARLAYRLGKKYFKQAKREQNEKKTTD